MFAEGPLDQQGSWGGQRAGHAPDDALASRRAEAKALRCCRAITVSFAFKKDMKGERHGTPNERLLAEQNAARASASNRPNTLFATGGALAMQRLALLVSCLSRRWCWLTRHCTAMVRATSPVACPATGARMAAYTLICQIQNLSRRQILRLRIRAGPGIAAPLPPGQRPHVLPLRDCTQTGAPATKIAVRQQWAVLGCSCH